MKKMLLIFSCCTYILGVNAQCTIDPFIQQNYELDAKMLAHREIQSDPNDPDYNNPFIPIARLTPYLEKLSAIYQNPDNLPEIDSLFNEFQFHTNSSYRYAFTDQEVLNTVAFTVNSNVSWVDILKNTGVSGHIPLDNLMTQYQFSYDYHYDNNIDNTTRFYLKSSYDVLNIRPILPDFSAIQDITNVVPHSEYPLIGPPYTGVSYIVSAGFLSPSEQAEICDIKIDSNGIFEFWLGGGDCFNSCIANESRYVTVSNNCNQVTFARTLSNDEFELSNVNMYPNPVNNVLHIQGIDHIKTIEVYSITGKKIDVSLQENAKVNVNNLEKGVYFLKITNEQNRSILKKFIKQ